MTEDQQIALVQECPDIIRAMLRLLAEHGYKIVVEEIAPSRLIQGGKGKEVGHMK